MKEQSMLKSSIIILILAAAIGASVPATTYAQSGSAEAREKQIYSAATAAMDSGQWQSALDQFSQIRGSRVDGATYWKAYAQDKLGQRAAALETIASLVRQFPRSTWINDAKVLEMEIRGAAGQVAPPAGANGDEDLKLYALNAVMGMDPEQAVPLLEKLLNGSASANVKQRALFVLSQSSSTRAQELMASIARGQVQPDLQIKAIQNLGVSGRKKVLSDIYPGVNAEAKRAVLRAMGIAGAKDELLAAARSERDAQLRKEAVNGLAVAGGKEQLRQLYKESTDTQTKRDLLRSSVITGDPELLKNAMSDSDVEVRREAIRTMGVTGGSDAIPLLVNTYSTDKDQSTRNAAIDALFVRGAAHELVELLKKETDPEMKKRLVSKVSIMNNKEATEYMIQLLEK
jgi:HEAT repeat protein